MHLVTTLRSFTFSIISSLFNDLISLKASCLLELTFSAKKKLFFIILDFVSYKCCYLILMDFLKPEPIFIWDFGTELLVL